LAAEKAETSRDIPSRLFLVVSAEMVALLPFPGDLGRESPEEGDARPALPEGVVDHGVSISRSIRRMARA
jgi:hypothetical protein